MQSDNSGNDWNKIDLNANSHLYEIKPFENKFYLIGQSIQALDIGSRGGRIKFGGVLEINGFQLIIARDNDVDDLTYDTFFQENYVRLTFFLELFQMIFPVEKQSLIKKGKDKL